MNQGTPPLLHFRRYLHSIGFVLVLLFLPLFPILSRAQSNLPFTGTFSALDQAPVLSIVGTSESHTSDATADTGVDPRPVAVGEVIRYRLRAFLPESTSISFALRNGLPEGIDYIPGSARVSYLANTSPSFSGDFAGIKNESTPTFTFPAGRVGFDGGTRELSFNFGSIINNDGDADSEFILVEFNAVVRNIAANNVGIIWSSDFDVVIDEGFPTEVIATSNAVFQVVQEPGISAGKTLVSPVAPAEASAGNSVVFRISLSAAVGMNNTAAFDIRVRDLLDNRLILDSVTLSNNGGYAAISADNSTTGPGGNVDLVIDTIRPGDTLELTIDATVVASVIPGSSISNTVTIGYTSLPGVRGTNNVTPGATGATDGERNGSGGVNDYSAGAIVDTALIVVPSLTATKSIAATSEPHTGDTTADTPADPRPVVVGERITYRLMTEVPEATPISLVLTDTLATNIEVVANSARVSYRADNAFSGNGTFGANELTPTTSITPSFNAGTRELRFVIGDLLNNDNDGNAEVVIVEFSALVIDVPANTPGTTWSNSYDADSANNGVTAAESNPVVAELVQPELTLTKARTDSGPVIAGDRVHFEVTLSHTAGSSADALNMSVTDSLPTTGMALDGVTGGTCSNVTTSETTGTITFDVPMLSLSAGTCTIRYGVVAGADLQPGTTYTNTVQASYATVAGANARTLSTNTSNAGFTTDQVNLSLSKSVTPSSAAPGAPITYTLQFSNTGFTATNIVISDTLPAEIVVQSRTFGGDVPITSTLRSATEEVFVVSELRNGQSGVITIVAQLNTGLSAGRLFSNSAVITSAEIDTDPSDNSAADPGVTVLNVAPIPSPVAAQTISETNLLTFAVSAADLNNDTFTFSLNGAPVGASINATNGVFNWTPTNAQGPGVYSFDVIVSDGDQSESVPITVTVLDTDLSYSVAVDPSELIEGDTGTQGVIVTISRNGATYGPSEVDFSLSGSASAGVDYHAPNGPISFAAGEISRTLMIAIVGDRLNEPDEMITITLENGTVPIGGIVTYSMPRATLTIITDETVTIMYLPLIFNGSSRLVLPQPAKTSKPAGHPHRAAYGLLLWD